MKNNNNNKKYKLFLLGNFASNSWFPKYTLYLHQDRKGWVSIKEGNFDFILINNGSVNNCDFIEKGISCS